MNDIGAFSIALILGIVAALGYGVVTGIYDIFKSPPPPPTEQEAWIAQQRERCSAMRSGLSYDEKTNIAECWRTPFMRQPKLMFRETYRS